MKVKKEQFGILASGDAVSIFTVSNGTVSFSAIDYGCCITGILLPTARGGYDDVVLGYSTLEGYIRNVPHFGSLIGRCAGRIGYAKFSLDGTAYALTRNSHGRHCLHGGYPFYDKQLWSAESFSGAEEAGVRFFKISPDGEQGFPGEVRLTVSYSLNSDNEIILRYEAETTKTTPINLTNHSYFNLNPAGMQDDGSYVAVLNHQVQIYSDSYVETDAEMLPTGTYMPVEGTPFDFRRLKTLKQDFDALENGYDGTWLLKKESGKLPSLAAVVKEPQTGRELHIYSTQPALTMYTGNFLNGERGKNGDIYNKYSGVCFETQHIPDSPNRPEFPPVWISPGTPYRHETRWRFKF
ncbi:MAG: galactose mutarotase [Treponema sp.]